MYVCCFKCLHLQHTHAHQHYHHCHVCTGAAHPHFVAAVSAIVAGEGVGAPFSGLPLALVKQAPQAAVTFSCYEVRGWMGCAGGLAGG